MNVVHEIIATHHGSHTGVHRSLEGRKIDFIDGAFISVRAHMMAVELLIIQGKMLDRGHHTLGLYSLDVSDGCSRGQARIFTHILEVSAAKRAAADVHARAQKDMHTPCAGILAEGYTHLICHVLVPGCGSRHSAGKESTPGVIANSLRTIRHTDERNAETFDRTDIEAILGTAYIVAFLFKGHPGNQCGGSVPMLLSDRISDIISRLMRRTAGACQKRHADCY